MDQGCEHPLSSDSFVVYMRFWFLFFFVWVLMVCVGMFFTLFCFDSTGGR